MKFTTALLFIVDVCIATAIPERAAKPAAFFLAGDSTTAIGGGWGNGFLGTLKNGATGTNYGHNGATTVSFVDGGDWKNVIAAVKGATSKYTPYVTICFGHNDQKPEKNISVAQYTTNLQNLGLAVRKAGGEPIFLTSVSRRSYNSSNLVVENLAPQAAATKVAAKAISATVVDLNRASTDYLNKIGETNAHKYNLEPTDNTHFNANGGIVFGNLVSVLVGEKGFKEWTAPNATIATALSKGKFIWPGV